MASAGSRLWGKVMVPMVRAEASVSASVSPQPAIGKVTAPAIAIPVLTRELLCMSHSQEASLPEPTEWRFLCLESQTNHAVVFAPVTVQHRPWLTKAWEDGQEGRSLDAERPIHQKQRRHARATTHEERRDGSRASSAAHDQGRAHSAA